jgi:alpha-ribazole phosphatase
MGRAMKRSTLYVVRHAPVGVKGVCYGQCDVPTTIDDEAASNEIVQQIVGAGVSLEAVYASHVARTRPLAEAVARHLGIPAVIDRRIAELSMGAWEGMRFSDIEANDTARYWRWMEHWRDEAPPGGETAAELEERVGAWRREMDHREVLAVTHAGVIRVLRAHAEGVGFAEKVGEPVLHLVVEPVRNLR